MKWLITTLLDVIRALFMPFAKQLPLALGILTVSCPLLLGQAALADPRFVRVDGDNGLVTPTGTPGDAWNNAFKYLQDALDYAFDLQPSFENPVEIRVRGDDDSDGIVYYPDDGAGLTAEDEELSFGMLNFVSILGGFRGPDGTPGSNPDERLPATFKTVLSGNISATGQDSYHVVTAGSTITHDALIDGFTITGGVAKGSDTDGQGAGIFIDRGYPRIRGCTISNNLANRGAGIMCLDTEVPPEVRNCKIIGNSATGTHDPKGGGLDTTDSVTVINTEFRDNHADEWGGGLSVEDVGCTEQVCTAQVVLVNCQFIDNDCVKYGGGVYMSGEGGTAQSDLVLTNCLFNYNRATSSEASNGGGIWLAGVTLTMTNCTVVHCSVEQGEGGGLAFYPSGNGSTISNCIFFDNVGPLSQDIATGGVTPTISNSVMQELPTAGTFVNLTVLEGSESPNFVDNSHNNPPSDPPTLNNYRLNCPSVCINSGIVSAVPTDSLNVDEDSSTAELTPDLDLNNRSFPGAQLVDMGCYEKQATPEDPCRADVNSSGVVNIDDLLVVIMAWGACPAPPAACAADITPQPCHHDGNVNIDDLLFVITYWGWNCALEEFTDVGSLSSVEDCMEEATNLYEPYSYDWDDFVDKCVQALCEANIIECD